MQTEKNFITKLHTKTKRNYLERVVEHNKAECATVAKQFGADYWDGDRKYGYGGYRYDGRWAQVADHFIATYGLTNQSKILDVGCGKGFLLFELQKKLPQAQLVGVDISEYGLAHAVPEIKSCLKLQNATELKFEDQSFDLVYSITTLHNLYIFDLAKALKEMQRVSRNNASYLAVESYRNESEKANLLYWQLTCESFFTPTEWVWLFNHFGYYGDYEFIYFE